MEVSLTDSFRTSVTLYNLDFVADALVGGLLLVASEGRDDNMVGC